MTPNLSAEDDAQRRRAQRILRWIIGAVIVFNLGVILWLFLPR